MKRTHYAADLPVEIVGRYGKFTTSLVDADLSAPLRKRAPESLEGELGVSQQCLRLPTLSVRAPLRPIAAGRYVLRATSFTKRGAPPMVCGSTQSAPRFASDGDVLMPRTPRGGVRPPEKDCASLRARVNCRCQGGRVNGCVEQLA